MGGISGLMRFFWKKGKCVVIEGDCRASLAMTMRGEIGKAAPPRHAAKEWG